MFGSAGFISMIVMAGMMSIVVGVSSFLGLRMQQEYIGESAVQKVAAAAQYLWNQSIASQVQAHGVDGPFTAPAGVANYSLCGPNDGTCNVTVAVTFAITSNTGGVSESVDNLQRAAAPTPAPWATPPPTCNAVEGQVKGSMQVKVTSGDGSTLATRHFTLTSRTICTAPYVAGGTITDDASVQLNNGGQYWTAGQTSGCDSAHPYNCDTLQAAQGSSTASDTNIHAVLNCQGKWCSGDPNHPDDVFQTVNQTDSGVGTVPR